MTPPATPPRLPTPWPTQTDYQDALQNPRVAFAADPELREAEVLGRTPFGLPAPVSGQYANVYRVRLPGGRQEAVRLFLRGLEGREATYQALETHVAALRTPPPFLVPFRYRAQGVRVLNRTYPLVQMDWAEGVPLNAYVASVVNDQGALASLLARWNGLVGSLEAARIAHGDLQHGNVLVEPATGAIRLIDYDGVFVPPLAGLVAGRENGHPGYQHPARRPADYGPLMDRFSALVVHTALYILSRSPDLWYRLDNGDNLLFSGVDFADPEASRAFYLLAHSPHGQVRRAARALRDVLRVPLYKVPDVERFAASLG